MSPTTNPAPGRTLGLGTILVVLFAALGLGLAQKAGCAGGDWGDGRQYRALCYSDIVPLYGTEQLGGGRLPYLDACEAGGPSCDEYPVLTMYSMRIAAWAADDIASFFYANAFLLAVAAVVATVALYLLVGERALYLAAAPTLVLYAFVNWDLVAVALATAGLLAFFNRRDVAAGALLGLGAAAKLYPGLLLLPLVLERIREREPDAGIRLAWTAVGAWAVVNLPFAIGGTGGWLEFFRLSSSRPSDWDSLWAIACNRVSGGLACANTGLVNLASALVFLGAATLVWRAKARRQPDFSRWTLAFPLLVAFLLSNKVYSPQFSLWLLPLFALALPRLRLFALFSAAEVAVFVTRFAWFGRLSEDVSGWVDAVPIGAFQLAVVARDLVLVACLAAWVRSEPPPVPGAVPKEIARPDAVPAGGGAA